MLSVNGSGYQLRAILNINKKKLLKTLIFIQIMAEVMRFKVL